MPASSCDTGFTFLCSRQGLFIAAGVMEGARHRSRRRDPNDNSGSYENVKEPSSCNSSSVASYADRVPCETHTPTIRASQRPHVPRQDLYTRSDGIVPISNQEISSMNASMLDFPPPYAIVAQESNPQTSSRPSSVTHSSPEATMQSLETDATSVSSLDLIPSDDDEQTLSDFVHIKRFRSTPQLSSSTTSSAMPIDHRTLHRRRHGNFSNYQRFFSMVPSLLVNESFSPVTKETTEEVEPLEPLPMAFEVLLHTLRLFAVVPGLIGTVYMLHASYVQARQNRWLRDTYLPLTPSAIEYVACSLWSICTAFHALSLMTMLLRRWLIYYTLVPSLIRLITFQAICWSLVRAVLLLFGPAQPVASWIIVSTFTSFFEIFARWITSNITDVDDTQSTDGLLSDMNETGASDAEGMLHSEQEIMYDSYQPRARHAARSHRYQKYRNQSLRVIRALTGAPTEVTSSDSDSDTFSKPESGFSSSMQEDMNALSPVVDMDHWHRRLIARRNRKRRHRSRHKRSKQKSRMSAFFQNYRAARIHSRRVFHWNVAIWRNVVPIGILGYLTLWVLLAEFTITRFQASA